MKPFNQIPVYNDTAETLCEKSNVTKLVEYERYCRDMMLFDAEKECFSEDSYVKISWFNGSGREFVERSRSSAGELWTAPKHKMYNTFVWLNGDKAAAEAQCMMGAYNTVDGVQYHRLGWARLLYRVQKEGGLWKVKGLDCIYERDMLIPVVPSAALDASEFEKYRPSYKCLSWVLDKRGIPCSDRLPGDDRPSIVEELYTDTTNWLAQDKLLPPLKPLAGAEQRARMARVAFLERNDAERYQGTEPVDVKKIYDALLADYDSARAAYFEKRIILTGVVSKIGPDVWGVPSIELSDRADGRCYALVVFPSEDIYDKVRIGSSVEVLGNILNIREPYGIVVKKSVLLKE